MLELVNSHEIMEEIDSINQRVVLALYEALSSHDVAKVHQVLAPDLEWWFHGPPSHQFLMHLLTGITPASATSFRFVPQSITSFGPIVLVEGCDHDHSISWVHACTVTDGIITQVREYFNTSLTVMRLGNSNSSSMPSSSSRVEITPLHCPSLWESSVSSQVGKSVPGGNCSGLIAWDQGRNIVGTKKLTQAGFNDPLLAKALGAFQAVIMALERGIDCVIFEGDSSQVVKGLYSHVERWDRVGMVLSDIRLQLPSFVSRKFLFVKRSGNTLAHVLAKSSLDEDSIVLDLMPDCSHVISDD